MRESIFEDHIVPKIMDNAPDYNSSKSSTSETLVKPKIVIRKEDEGIVLMAENFQADAMRIFSKRSSEEKFSLLAQVSSSKYADTRPNLYGAPELREYMVQFIVNEKPVGATSDIILIIKK